MVPKAIRSSYGDMRENLDVFSMFPLIGSAGRRFASLHRVLWDKFPCFHGTIEALRLPTVRLAALRFLRLAIPRGASWSSLPPLKIAMAVGRGTLGSALPHTPNEPVETTGPPKFLGNPDCFYARFSDSGRTARTHYRGGANRVAPAKGNTKAPALGLSKLNRLASKLAVYASQGGLPHRHARLASRCWLRSPGRAWLPAGSR
jgi:hypothetical protein